MNFSNLKLGSNHRSGRRVRRKVVERIHQVEENKPVDHPPPTQDEIQDAVYVGKYRISRKTEKSETQLTRSVKNYKKRYEVSTPELKSYPELVLICRAMHQHSIECYALPHQVRPSRAKQSPEKTSPKSRKRKSSKKAKEDEDKPRPYITDAVPPPQHQEDKKEGSEHVLPDSRAPLKDCGKTAEKPEPTDAVVAPEKQEPIICDTKAPPKLQEDKDEQNSTPAGCEVISPSAYQEAGSSSDEYSDPENYKCDGALSPPIIKIHPNSEVGSGKRNSEGEGVKEPRDTTISNEFFNQNVVSLPSDHAQRPDFKYAGSSEDEKTGNRINSIQSSNTKESNQSDSDVKYAGDPQPRVASPQPPDGWHFGKGMQFFDNTQSSDWETLLGVDNPNKEYSLMFTDFDDMIDNILSQRPTGKPEQDNADEKNFLQENLNVGNKSPVVSGDNGGSTAELNVTAENSYSVRELVPENTNSGRSIVATKDGISEGEQTFFSSGISKHFDASTHSVEHASHTLYSLRTSFLSSGSSSKSSCQHRNSSNLFGRGDRPPEAENKNVYTKILRYPQERLTGADRFRFPGNRRIFPKISGRFSPHTKYGPPHGCKEKIPSPFTFRPDLYREPRIRKISLDSDLNDIADKIRDFKKLLSIAPQVKAISPFYDQTYRPNPVPVTNPVPGPAPAIQVTSEVDSKDAGSNSNDKGAPAQSSTCGPITYNYFYGAPTSQSSQQALAAPAQCPGLDQLVCGNCHGVIPNYNRTFLPGGANMTPVYPDPMSQKQPSDTEEERADPVVVKENVTIRNEQFVSEETEIKLESCSSNKPKKQYFKHGVILEDDWTLDEVSALYRPWPKLNSPKFRMQKPALPPVLPMPPLPTIPTCPIPLGPFVPPLVNPTAVSPKGYNYDEQAPVICDSCEPSETLIEYPPPETLMKPTKTDEDLENVLILRVSSPPTAPKSIDPVARHIYVPDEDELADYHKPSGSPVPIKSIASGVKSREKKSQSKTTDNSKSEHRADRAEDSLADMESLKNFDQDVFLAGIADEIDNQEDDSLDSEGVRELANRFAEFLENPESVREVMDSPLEEDLEHETLQATIFDEEKCQPTCGTSTRNMDGSPPPNSSWKPLFSRRKRFRHFTARPTPPLSKPGCSVLQTFESGLQQRLNNALLLVSLSRSEQSQVTTTRKCCRCNHQNMTMAQPYGTHFPSVYPQLMYGGYPTYANLGIPVIKPGGTSKTKQATFKSQYEEIRNERHFEEIMEHPLLQNPIYAEQALPFLSSGYVPPFLEKVEPKSEERKSEQEHSTKNLKAVEFKTEPKPITKKAVDAPTKEIAEQEIEDQILRMEENAKLLDIERPTTSNANLQTRALPLPSAVSAVIAKRKIAKLMLKFKSKKRQGDDENPKQALLETPVVLSVEDVDMQQPVPADGLEVEQLDWAGNAGAEDSISVEEVQENLIEVDFSEHDNKRKNSMFLDSENNIRSHAYEEGEGEEEPPLATLEAKAQNESGSDTPNEVATPTDTLNQIATDSKSHFTAESQNQSRATAESQSQNKVTAESQSQSRATAASLSQSQGVTPSQNQGQVNTEAKSQSKSSVEVQSLVTTDSESYSYTISEPQQQSFTEISSENTVETYTSSSITQISGSVSTLIGKFENMSQKH